MLMSSANIDIWTGWGIWEGRSLTKMRKRMEDNTEP